MPRRNDRNRHGAKQNGWRSSEHKAKRDNQKKARQMDATPTARTGKKISKPAGTATTGTKGYTKMCEHWQQPFDLGGGLTIYASAYFDGPSQYSVADEELRLRTFKPDVGVYLDSYWQWGDVMVTPGTSFPGEENATEKVLYPWADKGVPSNITGFTRVVEWMIGAASEGKTVDTGCLAAHGRTGTMLSCLLVYLGMEATEAIRKVRAEHCRHSVESLEQVGFVKRFDTLINKREHVNPYKVYEEPNYGNRKVDVSGMSPATQKFLAAGVGTQQSWQSDDLYQQLIKEQQEEAAYREKMDGVQTWSDDTEYEEWLRLNAMQLAEYEGEYAAGEKARAENSAKVIQSVLDGYNADGTPKEPQQLPICFSESKCPHPRECVDSCLKAETGGDDDSWWEHEIEIGTRHYG